MNKKILLRKTCSVYASDLHLATMIFPFVDKEIKKGAIIKPILERNILENIEKIIKNININKEIKNKIQDIDWLQTDIDKIKNTLHDIEASLHNNTIHIIVSGTNLFIEKVNKLIDLWAKMNLELIEKNQTIINVINCYSFSENDEFDKIVEKHEFILKTTGIETLYQGENLKKAN